MPRLHHANGGIVDCIIGRVEVLEAGACTVTVVKPRSGVSIANGTAIGSLALQAGVGGTALTPVVLTQIGPSPGSFKLNPGDTVGIQSTGSFSASVGNINIYAAVRTSDDRAGQDGTA